MAGQMVNTQKISTDGNEVSEPTGVSAFEIQKMLEGIIGPLAKRAIGKPDRPAFQSLLDPTTGLMQGQYQIDGQATTTGLDKLTQEANRTSPSVWRGLMEGQKNQAVSGMNQDANASQVRQMDMAAMRGGAGAGTGQALARQGALQSVLNTQKGAQMGQQFDIQDEANRQAAIKQLPGAELAQAGFNRDTENLNVGNALRENLQKRASDINFYNEDMRAWAAERTAAATPSGGKK